MRLRCAKGHSVLGWLVFLVFVVVVAVVVVARRRIYEQKSKTTREGPTLIVFKNRRRRTKREGPRLLCARLSRSSRLPPPALSALALAATPTTNEWCLLSPQTLPRVKQQPTTRLFHRRRCHHCHHRLQHRREHHQQQQREDEKQKGVGCLLGGARFSVWVLCTDCTQHGSGSCRCCN